MPEAFKEAFVAVLFFHGSVPWDLFGFESFRGRKLLFIISSLLLRSTEASMGFGFESFRGRQLLFIISNLLLSSTEASVKASVEENLLPRKLP